MVTTTEKRKRKLQWVWTWWSWGFGFRRLDVSVTSLGWIYDWCLFIGPLEIRKWTDRKCPRKNWFDYKERGTDVQ